MGFFDKFKKKKEEKPTEFNAQTTQNAENEMFKLELFMNECEAKLEKEQKELNQRLADFNATPDPTKRRMLEERGTLIMSKMKTIQSQWQRAFNQYKAASGIVRMGENAESIRSLENMMTMRSSEIEAAGQALVAAIRQYDEEQAAQLNVIDTIENKINNPVQSAGINEEFQAQAATVAATDDTRFLNNMNTAPTQPAQPAQAEQSEFEKMAATQWKIDNSSQY